MIVKSARVMRKKELILMIILLSGFLSNIVFSKEVKKSDTVNAGTGVTQTHELEPFDTINLSGMGNLYIKQSEVQSFSVDASEVMLPLIKVSVLNKVLYIDVKNASSHTQEKINYNLSVKEIKAINSYGSSTIFIQDGFNSHVLSLLISNLGESYIKKLNVDKLSIKINGGGTIEASGVADQQSIVINGAGEFNGSKLSGQVATVDIIETGIVKVNATNSLSTTILGEGTIKYCGKPNITRQVSSGNDTIITPLLEKECKL